MKNFFFVGIIFFTGFHTLQADQQDSDSAELSSLEDFDSSVQPDFSDELDSMIDHFDDTAFVMKEPSRIVVFLRSVADPVVYYMMKIYGQALQQIRNIRVKILALLARNNKSLYKNHN